MADTQELPLKQRLLRQIFRIVFSLRKIAIVYVLSLALAAALFAIAEGSSFWDGFWWSSTTALTIGYGDIYPVTAPGRVIGIIFGHFWIFVIAPMIVANIVVRVFKNVHIFTHLEQEWLLDVVGKIAQKLGVKVPPQPSDTDYDPAVVQK